MVKEMMLWNDCEEMPTEFEEAAETFVIGLMAAIVFAVAGWWVTLMLWAALSSPPVAGAMDMADEPGSGSSAYFAETVNRMAS